MARDPKAIKLRKEDGAARVLRKLKVHPDVEYIGGAGGWYKISVALNPSQDEVRNFARALHDSMILTAAPSEIEEKLELASTGKK